MGIVDPLSVAKTRALLARGNEVKQMMTVLGEEGISIVDLTVSLKADFFDSVYLQQNAYDAVDADCSIDRQREVFVTVMELVQTDFHFLDRGSARRTLMSAASLFKQWNAMPFRSEEYLQMKQKIEEFIHTKGGT